MTAVPCGLLDHVKQREAEGEVHVLTASVVVKDGSQGVAGLDPEVG
jgi:hypothetical protein